jgi:hypothetical protein
MCVKQLVEGFVTTVISYCDVGLGSLTPFLNLRTEEHRLKQATALLLMRRTCNL